MIALARSGSSDENEKYYQSQQVMSNDESRVMIDVTAVVIKTVVKVIEVSPMIIIYGNKISNGKLEILVAVAVVS